MSVQGISEERDQVLYSTTYSGHIPTFASTVNGHPMARLSYFVLRLPLSCVAGIFCYSSSLHYVCTNVEYRSYRSVIPHHVKIGLCLPHA